MWDLLCTVNCGDVTVTQLHGVSFVASQVDFTSKSNGFGMF